MSNLLTKIQPFLEPDEQVHTAFTGQTGINPALSWVNPWLIVVNKARIIAVTDRRIAVLKAGQFRWARQTPKALIYSMPRATRLEHGTHGWSKVPVGGESIWTSRNAYPLLDRLNAEITAPPAAPR